MMRRSAVLLVLACFVLQGGWCGNYVLPWIAFGRSNDIDRTDVRFTLTVRDEFECIDAYPQSAFLVFDRLRQSSTGNVASIVVGPETELASGEGITLDELDSSTNAN